MTVAASRSRSVFLGAPVARRLAGLGLLLPVALVSGCGGALDTVAVPPANAATQTQGSPPAPVEASPTPSGGDGEIDALLHDLRIAKERVDRELARKEQLAVAREQELDSAAADAAPSSPPSAGGSGPHARPERKPAPGRAPAPEKKREQTRDDRAETESSSDSVGSPCDTACRAFASMERSAARICSLTSESDARCVSARAMVTASRERVESSGCWCRSFGPRGSER